MEQEQICGIIIAAIIIIFASYGAYTYYKEWSESKEEEEKRSKLVIEMGDRVTFEVTGYLVDGKIFYTTEASIDKDDSIPKTPNYKFFTDDPEVITVGEELSSKFNQGFTDQIQNLKIDDKEILIVTPDKGYGWPNDTLIKQIPVSDSIPLYSELTRIDFQSIYNPDDIPLFIGQRFVHVYWKWPIELTEVNNDTIQFRHEPEQNDLYSVLPWNITVSGISEAENKLFITHIADRDTLYSTIDPIQLSEYDESYLDIQEIQSEIGIGPLPGVVVTIDNDFLTIDFNDERAGKTLYYEVKIIDIKKT